MVAIVGAVGVEVVPNVRSFNREMRSRLMPEADKLGQDLGASMGRNMRERLGVELKNLPNAKVGLDDSSANRQIAELKAKLDELGRKHETATVRVNTNDASRSIDSLTKKINGSGGLMAGLLALAPATIPVAAAVTAGVAAIGSSFVAATPAVGVFGLAVKDSFGAAKSAAQALSQAQGKVNAAQKALNDAKGPAARTAALKKLTAAQQHLNEVEKGLSPATRSLAKDYGEVTAALTKWDMKAALPAVAKVTKTLMPAIRVGLKAMTPLVTGAGNAFATLGTMISKAVTGPGGKKFISFLEVQGPKAIVGFGKAIGHIITGIGGIVLAFSPFQHTLLSGLDKLTGKFAAWGQNLGSSSSFHKFIQYVKDNGPQLGKFLQTAGAAVVALVKAAAGFGAGELKTMTSVLGALVKFANAHPQVAKLAVATLALAKAVQVLKLASIGGGIAKLFTVLAGAKVAGVAGTVAGDAAGAGAAGAASRSGGLASRAITLAGGGEVGIATLAGALGLVVAPLILSFMNKNFVRDSHDILNPPGSPAHPNPTVDSKGNPVPFRPVPVGRGPGGLVKSEERTASGAGVSAPPIIPKAGSGAFSIPVTINPSKPLSKDGKKLTIHKADIYVPPANMGIVLTPPQKKTVNHAVSVVNSALSGISSIFGGRGKASAPPTINPKIKVAVLGVDSAKKIIAALGSTIAKVPSKKQIRVAESGAKTVASALGSVTHILGGTPSKKQIKVAESGAKTAASAIGQVKNILGGTPNKKNTKVSTSGAGIAHTAIAAIKTVLGQTPNKKDIHHSTPGAGAAHAAIAAIKTILGQTPNKKVVQNSTPGAAAAHTAIGAIKTILGQTPNKKAIQHSTPGSLAAHSAIAAIKLVLSQTPNRKDIHASTPGAAAAQAAIRGIKDVLAGIPSTKSVALKVIGSASDALSHFSFASGGHVQGPGGPRDDRILARLSNNEFVQPAHVVQSEGVDKMEALRKGRATIVPKFADGGLVINTSDPGVAGMPKNIKGFLAAAASHIGKDQEKHLQKALSSLGSMGGGGGNWGPVIAQALTLLHQPVGLAGLFERVIAGESGGNPRAINLTDSNAQAGHPSVGLAQVIRGTFEAFAGPFRNVGPFLAGVSINPLANIFAGLNYGIQTYGSVANIPGIASELHGGGYRPYATGGPVPGSGNRDSVPAMLTPGEFVLNKGAVSKVGMGILHAINGGAGTGDGFFHAGGPVLGIHYGAVGEWVKALAIQARQLKGAFHQSKWDGRVSTDVAAHPPKHLPNLAKYDPKVKQLVAYLWGRHGKATTFDDALAHFSHGDHPMAFLDIMRAYDAGKGYLTEFKGKGKSRHRFIPDSTLGGFQKGLRRYESMYHHDVQALEHKLKYKPENGTWGAGLDAPVEHVIDHALHKAHSQFLARPWNPLNAGEKTLQQVLKSNQQTAELNKDLNQFIKWGLFDLVENISSGNQDASMLPTARAAAKNRGLATKLNAAYKVADRTTGINPLVNLGYSAIKYDNGGYIQPGHTMVINKTNKPEPVLSSDQWDMLRRGGGKPGINIEHVEVHDGSDVVAFGRQLAFTLANAGL